MKRPSLQEQIEILKKHAIEYLELRFVDGRPFAEATPAQAKEIRFRLEEAGIRVLYGLCRSKDSP